MMNPNEFLTPDRMAPPGLTKRELFAAMAMQAVVASDFSEKLSYEKAAVFAIEQADALIAELSKETK